MALALILIGIGFGVTGLAVLAWEFNRRRPRNVSQEMLAAEAIGLEMLEPTRKIYYN